MLQTVADTWLYTCSLYQVPKFEVRFEVRYQIDSKRKSGAKFIWTYLLCSNIWFHNPAMRRETRPFSTGQTEGAWAAAATGKCASTGSPARWPTESHPVCPIQRTRRHSGSTNSAKSGDRSKLSFSRVSDICQQTFLTKVFIEKVQRPLPEAVFGEWRPRPRPEISSFAANFNHLNIQRTPSEWI